MGNTALLVCDIQNGIVARIQGQDSNAYLDCLASTIKAARAAGLQIIYVRVAFRAGHPEASPRNATFSRLKTFGGFVETDPSTAVHPTVAPEATDVVVTKRRVSAFHGTDLDLVLRAGDVEKLVIAGLSTSGVVMSTVRQGSDMDYQLVVLEDLCCDSEQAIHDAAIMVIGKQAEVLKSEEWVAGLQK